MPTTKTKTPRKRARTISETKFISVLTELLPKAVEEGTEELRRSLSMTDRGVGGLERLYEGIREELTRVQVRLDNSVVHGIQPGELKRTLGLNVPETEDRFDAANKGSDGELRTMMGQDVEPEPDEIAPEPDDPWAHRTVGMRCRTCMWFVGKPGEVKQAGTSTIQDFTKGRCRRRCPTMNGYPVVFEHDWCGDHKLA